MTEKQMIDQILNTVDVLYKFGEVNADKGKYIILVKQQDGDRRKLQQVNEEIKKYFEEADFTYTESIKPADGLEDIRIEIKR
ncbi:hypothetical protein [Lentilactobacillus laojiaonis]|uniref:hypothetical protein n=1 Tax=Lentilactobacillus laojiaonis TaxID=2883998 RepID=UPI001D0B0030|nr:hypothetical protein [Lentilactobacillus laojiaonis]UDM32058.1 hypothetical protein LHL71_05895 [Lentilactobacillus laojiaonis]